MASEPAPFVSVIVPVRNGERTVADCLTSLLELDYPTDSREILVVDNGSTDRTAEIVQRLPVTYLLEERVGRSHARNRGIEASSSELLAFIDADCVASPSWLRELVRAFATAEVDGVSGEILSYRPQTAAERYVARRQVRRQLPAFTHERPFAATANVCFRKSTFRRIGLFDPFFVTSEDVDLSYRFFAGGLKLGYCAGAVVYHRHRQTGRELFKQQVGLGYGRALTRTQYSMSIWDYELERYAQLGHALGSLATASSRWAVGRASVDDLSYAYYDAVLRSAVRLGALRWYLTRSRHPVSHEAPRLGLSER